MDARKPIPGSRTYNGERFPWGVFVKEHQVGEYTVLEFIVDNIGVSGADPEDHGRTHYLVPSRPGSTSGTSFLSMDAALIHSISYKNTDDEKLTKYLLTLIDIE